MKKTTFAIVTLLMMASSLMAAPVTELAAHRVAVNFWNTYRPQEVKPVASMQALAFPELQHLYVFANGDQGFVVVASDNRVRPVVGYSFDSPFPTRLHPELRYWLSTYEEQIAYATTTDADADPRWDELLSSDVPLQPKSLANVPMLCSTRWDQGKPYNLKCPYDTVHNDYAVVGCVATAMAQIMKRWNHPSCGVGNHSYTHYTPDFPYSYGVLSADYEHTTYRWETMPNYVAFASTDEENEALSTLSYHCAVSVNMQFGTMATGGSGAYSDDVVYALPHYFKYDSVGLGRLDRWMYSDAAWLAKIDDDLAAGRPIYYSGRDADGGHAFILDGSNLDTMYHFNWGWGGYGDGFYAMSNLAPGGGGAGGNSTYTFNLEQAAIFGIQPLPEPFDTITVYDTICTNTTSYEYHGYTLSLTTGTNINLRHLDTIFAIHLQVVPMNSVSFSANVGITSGVEQSEYCVADGIEMIECPFTRDNYHFIGWSTMKSGTPDTLYQAGDRVFAQGNVVFYARWKKNSSEGVTELQTPNPELTVYPNPTAGELNVTLETAQEAQVQVFDAVGRVILRQTLCGEGQISLSAMPEGVYYVQVKTADGIYNQRVIKQ